LERAAQVFQEGAIAISTWKSYNGALESFYLFCKKRNLNAFIGPISAPRLRWGRGDGRDLDSRSVVLWMSDTGLDPRYRGSTVKLYVSALRKYELDHATVGLPLHSPRITAIVEGIRRKKGVENDGAPTPKKKGLTIDMLVQIEAQALDQGTLRTFEDKLFFAATTVGVAGLFRSVPHSTNRQ
jgi:hypothetical protein